MYLTITEPGRTPAIVELSPEKQSWSLGRDEKCDIVLKVQTVSRRHALLTREKDGFYIQDCGAKRGVEISGRRIEERVKLECETIVRLADCVIVLSKERGVPSYPPVHSADRPNRTKATLSSGGSAAGVAALYNDAYMQVKKRIHERILSEMHLGEISASALDLDNPENRSRVEKALAVAMREEGHHIQQAHTELFRQGLLDDVLGLGPITSLLNDDTVDEIMVNGPDRVFKEVGGKLYETGIRFYDERHLLSIIQRIVEKVGRHIDESSPMVDARLEDGSRVNAIIRPLAIDGASLTIRKFSRNRLTMAELINKGTLNDAMAKFLEAAVKCKQNILISGGTGSGKTTLLNILGRFIPQGERLVTIEDSAELKLDHRNLVRLEARPANIEGSGQVTIRELLVNSLRMRPDRIIIGECRSGEALDMLQAMNTGHDGSLTTIHANSPRDALSRLENMVLMAGYDLPVNAIREQVSSALNLIIQENRLSDGSRRITKISEITGREGHVVSLQDIFVFCQDGTDAEHHIIGHYEATGNVPAFIKLNSGSGQSVLDLSIFKKSAQE